MINLAHVEPILDQLTFQQLDDIEKGLMITIKLNITPATFTYWLENHNTKNRPLIDARVEHFRRLIDYNIFKCTHQGIAFSPDGVLLNGQHRGQGCILAGKAVDLMVTFNEPKENLLAIDDPGGVRDQATQINLFGIDWLTKQHVAVIKTAVFCARRTRNLTTQEIVSFALEYENQLKFLTSVKTARRLPASVLAVVFRALCQPGADQIRLSLFLTTAANPFQENIPSTDSAAVQLYRYFSGTTRAKSTDFRTECYFKTITAITAFLEQKTLSRLYVATNDNAYPLVSAVYDGIMAETKAAISKVPAYKITKAPHVPVLTKLKPSDKKKLIDA
jgi:hypothetical protein